MGGTFNILFKIIIVKKRLLCYKSGEESSHPRCSQKLFTTEHPGHGDLELPNNIGHYDKDCAAVSTTGLENVCEC